MPQVRRFAVENALYWLGDFRFDGLRLDAVHAIAEPGAASLLKELSRGGRRSLPQQTGRHIHLVLENDANQASLLDPLDRSAARQVPRAMERRLSSCLHVLLTGETAGYYGDYRDPAPASRARAGRGLRLSGRAVAASPGRSRAASRPRRLPPTAFVNFLQNHDQIGNRALGERLSVLAAPAALEAALAVTAARAAPPLMFMGDEWGAREPFPFFCDFKGELAEAVRDGRRKEFAEAYASATATIPDPLSERDPASGHARLDARSTTANTARGSIWCAG